MKNTEREQEDIRVTFIDLEKSYDRMPREEIWRCSRDRKVPKKHIRLIYVNTCTRDAKQWCAVRQGNQHLWGGGRTTPRLGHKLLMDVLTEDVRKNVPGSMQIADNIVLCGDDETDTTEYLETTRELEGGEGQ